MDILDPRPAASTLEAASRMPRWSIEAHLRTVKLCSEQRAQEISERVLRPHLDEQASVGSLMQLLREAEREFDSGT